jgi:hypothetical protein
VTSPHVVMTAHDNRAIYSTLMHIGLAVKTHMLSHGVASGLGPCMRARTEE